MAVEVKTPKQINRMRQAGHLLALVLKTIGENVRPGVTTAELDAIAEDIISSAGAYPIFKGYSVPGRPPFPTSTCMSVNEEVVHGIPSERKLKEGDILKVDVGAKWKLYVADTASTFPVGEIDEKKMRLVEVTRKALEAGLAVIKAGVRVSDVSRAVQTFVEDAGFSVVRQYCGHGLGRSLHEDPQIPNYVERRMLRFSDPILPEGATVAIEPMVNAGTYKTKELPNRWTVVTSDSEPSGHFEHTVVVRETGVEILTS